MMGPLANVDINVLGTHDGSIDLEIEVKTMLECLPEGKYGPYNKQCPGCRQSALLIKLVERVIHLVQHEYAEGDEIEILVRKRL